MIVSLLGGLLVLQLAHLLLVLRDSLDGLLEAIDLFDLLGKLYGQQLDLIPDDLDSLSLMFGLFLHGEPVLLSVSKSIMKVFLVLNFLVNELRDGVKLLLVVHDQGSLLKLFVFGVIDLLFGGGHVVVHFIFSLFLLLRLSLNI